MYHNKTVSVVFATYREKNSIKAVIDEFFSTGYVDEIIVVNNNAEEGTDEEIKKTKAKIVYETKQGYGNAYRTGIKNAKGYYIILCEPDGSYTGADLEKFFAYAKDGFDAVFGSRTGQNILLSGADMTVGRKWANVMEAKSIEVLFNTNQLSDVGCTYKLFVGTILQKLLKQTKTTNALFATELLLLTVTSNLNYIEIPITFSKRVGISTLTDKWYQLVKWAIYIQFFIFTFWFQNYFHRKKIKSKGIH
jgi:glycosyltransferase involved in cell wall biosynthesis